MINEKLAEIVNSLPRFCETFLTVRYKKGKIDKFKFNRAQKFAHERLEQQLSKTGYVRALILKGRQQGCSTYVQARFFHKVITKKGKRAFILTHEAEATKNLFNITKRYYDDLPQGLAPLPDKASAKELNFKSLNSGYSVGTARNKSVGRSQTIQLFHGSEAAYWENAELHQEGVLQTIAHAEETEIILESTANGLGNFFYNMWIGATTGKNEYQAIFLPWYWQDEYTSPPLQSHSPQMSEEEEALLDQFGEDGLTKYHLYWRRMKLAEFSNDHEAALEKFHKEYPMTALDAFRNPVDNRFISATIVQKARKNEVDTDSPLVIGVDPAVSDTDRLALIRRKGRYAYKLETHHNLNTMEIVGLVRRIIDSERPNKCCIDSIGVGAGVVDRLLELGYDCVEPVNVARRANCPDKFKNLRAELWHDMREWLSGEMPVQIPDSDELLGDLTSLGYKYDSSDRLQIESKQDLKKRGMKSPDTADALALTFAVGDYVVHGSYKPNYIPQRAAGMFI